MQDEPRQFTTNGGAQSFDAPPLQAWSSGLFTAWCEAVMTPWQLVPPPLVRDAAGDELLPVPDLFEPDEHALFA